MTRWLDRKTDLTREFCLRGSLHFYWTPKMLKIWLKEYNRNLRNRQTDKLKNRQTDKKTNRQKDKQTNRQTDKQTNRQKDKLTNWQTDELTNRQKSRHMNQNGSHFVRKKKRQTWLTDQLWILIIFQKINFKELKLSWTSFLQFFTETLFHFPTQNFHFFLHFFCFAIEFNN